MKIEVLVPKPEDAKEMDEVIRKTWLATYPNKEAGITVNDIEDYFEKKLSGDALKKREEQIRNNPENVRLLVAKTDRKIVGMSLGVRGPEVNKLRSLYILPEYQRMGIGSTLWNEVKKIFDPAKPTIVEVTTYNAKAINFYKKLGFVDTGKRFSEERFRMKSGAIFPEMEMLLKS